MTCKYMNWDWNTYHEQPIEFLQTVNLIRQIEAEEMDRQQRHANRRQ